MSDRRVGMKIALRSGCKEGEFDVIWKLMIAACHFIERQDAT